MTTTDDRPTATVPAATVTEAPTSSLTELVSGILSDGQKLLKQQIEMLRAEIREDFRKSKDVALYLGLGAGLIASSGLMLLIALVYFIQYLTEWHLAGCWGLVGGLTAFAGLLAFLAGRRIMATYHPLPDKSLNALTENVSWIAKAQPQT